MKLRKAVLFAFSLVCVAASAYGQEASTPSEERDRSRKLVELPKAAADLQRQAIEDLDRKARELAGTDEAKYTALIREGLSRLDIEVGNSERGLNANPNSATSSLDQAVAVTNEDRDPDLQAAVRRMLETGRFGIRMVGAADVPEGQQLETVAILAGSSETACSGVTIAQGVVLTAAHCVCELGLDKSSRQIAFGRDIKTASLVKTKPGSTRIFPATGENVASAFCSDYAKYNRKVCHRDIALVKFNADQMPKGVKAARFAAVGEMQEALDRVDTSTPLPMMVVGYGMSLVAKGNAFYYGDAGRKRRAQYTFFQMCSPEKPLNCAAQSSTDACLSGAEIQIRDLRYGVKDSCKGDSGGPAFVATKEGEWRLAALVSRGVSQTDLCGPGGLYSALYTPDVTKWLSDNGVVILN